MRWWSEGPLATKRKELNEFVCVSPRLPGRAPGGRTQDGEVRKTSLEGPGPQTGKCILLGR